MDKEFILAEIKRTADLNGGRALGASRFSKEKGINKWEWEGKFWARWSEAIRDAGIEPNERQGVFEHDKLCEAYARLALELGHLPTKAEVKIRKRSDLSFPSWDAITRDGTKRAFLIRLADFCRNQEEFISVCRLCEENLSSRETPTQDTVGSIDVDGYVYLAKTRRGYKIGRTDDWEQRLRQIQLHNADDVQLVHLIKTDDPSGVEAYWHRRFKSKRVVAKSKTGRRRNWYNLTTDDVRAFKRWRQI